MAFVSLAGRPPAGLSVRVLAAEPIVAVLPVGHRLADRAAVTLADLADEPFVDSPPGYGNRTEVDRGFAAAGLRRRVALEVADIATVAQYVRNGLGVALLPRFSVRRRSRPPDAAGQRGAAALDVRGGDRLRAPAQRGGPGVAGPGRRLSGRNARLTGYLRFVRRAPNGPGEDGVRAPPGLMRRPCAGVRAADGGHRPAGYDEHPDRHRHRRHRDPQHRRDHREDQRLPGDDRVGGGGADRHHGGDELRGRRAAGSIGAVAAAAQVTTEGVAESQRTSAELARMSHEVQTLVATSGC